MGVMASFESNYLGKEISKLVLLLTFSSGTTTDNLIETRGIAHLQLFEELAVARFGQEIFSSKVLKEIPFFTKLPLLAKWPKDSRHTVKGRTSFLC